MGIENKCTIIEKNKRIDKVEAWIIEGKTISAILRLGAEWDLTRRQIESYCTEAWERIKEVNAAMREENVARTLKGLDNRLCKAIAKGDVKAEAKGI